MKVSLTRALSALSISTSPTDFYRAPTHDRRQLFSPLQRSHADIMAHLSYRAAANALAFGQSHAMN